MFWQMFHNLQIKSGECDDYSYGWLQAYAASFILLIWVFLVSGDPCWLCTDDAHADWSLTRQIIGYTWGRVGS